MTETPNADKLAARKVRAKFFVTSIARTTYGGTVRLQAVTRGKDNAEWAAATPSGTVEMTVLNEVALAVFQNPGDEFYIDFSPAPKGTEG